MDVRMKLAAAIHRVLRVLPELSVCSVLYIWDGHRKLGVRRRMDILALRLKQGRAV